MRNQSHFSPGQPVPDNGACVCQTMTLGALQKWISHFALLDGTKERRLLAIPSRFPHAKLHGVLSLFSPLRGDKNVFAPKKSVASFLSLQRVSFQDKLCEQGVGFQDAAVP